MLKTISLYLMILNLLSILYVSKCSYVVGLHPGKQTMEISHKDFFISSVSANSLADIFSRATGNQPIIKQTEIDFPTAVFSEQASSVVTIVELKSKLPPASWFPIVNVDTNNLEDVKVINDAKSKLVESGYTTVTHQFFDGETNKLEEFLKSQNNPSIVVHFSGSSNSQRILSSVVPLTEFQISQYQIVLWTAVVSFLILMAAVLSIVNMEVIPDSLLMAKFQSNRTTKRE